MSKQYSRSYKRFCARQFEAGRQSYFSGKGPGRGRSASHGFINAHREVMADVEENRAAMAEDADRRRGF